MNQKILKAMIVAVILSCTPSQGNANTITVDQQSNKKLVMSIGVYDIHTNERTTLGHFTSGAPSSQQIVIPDGSLYDGQVIWYWLKGKSDQDDLCNGATVSYDSSQDMYLIFYDKSVFEPNYCQCKYGNEKTGSDCKTM